MTETGKLRVVRAADMRRVPWRNGRGVTTEIAIGPEGAAFERGDFAWRVSRAAVTEDGPFSEFPGFDRVIVALGGEGLALAHDGTPNRTIRPLKPYSFRGDWRTWATLLGGPVPDFNVFTRRGEVQASVEVLHGARLALVVLPGSAVVCPTGPARIVAAGETFDLAAGDAFVARDLDATTDVTAEIPDASPVLVVRIAPDHPTPPARYAPVRGREAAWLLVVGSALGVTSLLIKKLITYEPGHPLAHIPLVDRLRDAIRSADFYGDGSTPWVVAVGILSGLCFPTRWGWVICGVFLGPSVVRGVRIALDLLADPTSHSVAPFEFLSLWWSLLLAVPSAWIAAAVRRRITEASR